MSANPPIWTNDRFLTIINYDTQIMSSVGRS